MHLLARSGSVFFALALAACAGTRTTSVAPREAARACPLASDVRYAFAEDPDDGPSEVRVWSIPLGHRPGQGPPSPGPTTEAELVEAGLEPLPSTLFVLGARGESCRARVEGYASELVEDGPTNVRVVAITSDCVDDRAMTWVSARPFDGCTLAPAEAVAARTLGSDATLPEDPAPLPPLYADALALAPDTCEPPCTRLYAVRATSSTPSLAEVWVTDLVADPAVDPCSWRSDGIVALLAIDDGHARRVRFPELELHGVLRDAGGARVALFVDHAAWGAYELGAEGELGAGRSETTFEPNEEDGTVRSLAPYCGP
ncbi:MAG: hypothetical protein U0353_27370 [Sandaracinus sp.]